jgi:Arf/Sar family protein
MGAVLTRLLEVFWTKKLDIVVIGLENKSGNRKSDSFFDFYSGKTTLLSVLAHGAPVETVPTIGLNVKVFKKGSVNMKCWDIGTSQVFPSFALPCSTTSILRSPIILGLQEDKSNIEANGVVTQRGVT